MSYFMYRRSILLPTLVHGFHICSTGSTQKWLRGGSTRTVPPRDAIPIAMEHVSMAMVPVAMAIESVAEVMLSPNAPT